MNSTDNSIYRRRISPLEGMFLHAPYAIVTMTARIKGSVSKEMLQKAVIKVQARHTNLRLKVEYDDQGDPWFTSQDVQTIPVESIPRETDQDWMEVIHLQRQIPFDFEVRPAIRFFLVQSPDGLGAGDLLPSLNLRRTFSGLPGPGYPDCTGKSRIGAGSFARPPTDRSG